MNFESELQKISNWGFPLQSFNFTTDVAHLQTQICLPLYVVLVSVNWWWSEANRQD